MNSDSSNVRGFRIRIWHVILGIVLLGILVFTAEAVRAVTLSSPSRALRNSVVDNGGAWSKRVAFHAGGLTFPLLKRAALMFHLPPEARSALECVDGVEVGVYHLAKPSRRLDRGALLQEADKAMAGKGWERAVGVIDSNTLVGIYVPRNASADKIRCCVLVLDRDDLVIARANGDPTPLLRLLQKEGRLRLPVVPS